MVNVNVNEFPGRSTGIARIGALVENLKYLGSLRSLL
jgi:hypothetical protein